MGTSLKEISRFVGVDSFTRSYVFDKRSEAASLLILYSTIEVAIKAAVKAVLNDLKTEESRAFRAIFDEILQQIDKDSSGTDSRYIDVINDLLSEQKGFRPIQKRDFAKIKRLRNQIVHAACRNLDKDLKQIDPDCTIDLDDLFDTVKKLVASCLIFVESHYQDIEEYYNQAAGEAWASENQIDPND